MGKIELTGPQIKEFKKALSSAFTEDSLKEMLRCYELDWRWDEIKKGETYEYRLFNLIEHADSEGKVEKLIISAAKSKSNHPEIQKIVETYVDELIEIYNFDNNVLTKKSLLSLLNILKKANKFEVIGDVVRSIIPSIEINSPEKFKDFKDPILSNWFKCFMLLKLLIEEYPMVGERHRILTFVEHILKESRVDNSIKKELEKWLYNIDPKFKNQPSSLQQASSTRASASGTMQAYLMITVDTAKLQTKVREKSKTKVRAIASLLCISPTGERKEISIQIEEPESKDPGVLCERKELPKKIEQFIQQSISSALNNPENLLGCANYDLTIELFLGSKDLGEPIDRWEIKNEFEEPVDLGSKYRLVVRSYDRVAKPGLRNAFSKSWHAAKDFLGQNPDAVLLQEQIQHLDKIDSNKLNWLQEELKQKIGLKVSCALPESEKEMVKIFQAMLISGVPIAFWTRCREIPSCDLVAGIDQFLTTELLLNSCKLLEKLRRERALASDCKTAEKCWGRHLTVLWDDCDRMPPIEPFKQFYKGGQRSL